MTTSQILHPFMALLQVIALGMVVTFLVYAFCRSADAGATDDAGTGPAAIERVERS